MIAHVRLRSPVTVIELKPRALTLPALDAVVAGASVVLLAVAGSGVVGSGLILTRTPRAQTILTEAPIPRSRSFGELLVSLQEMSNALWTVIEVELSALILPVAAALPVFAVLLSFEPIATAEANPKRTRGMSRSRRRM